MEVPLYPVLKLNIEKRHPSICFSGSYSQNYPVPGNSMVSHPKRHNTAENNLKHMHHLRGDIKKF